MKALLALLKGIFLLAVLAALAYLWFWFNQGVSNAEVRDTVRGESLEIQARIDVRSKQLTAKVEEVDAKAGAIDLKLNDSKAQLDRIEGKLDQILKLASAPVIPDVAPVPNSIQEVQE